MAGATIERPVKVLLHSGKERKGASVKSIGGSGATSGPAVYMGFSAGTLGPACDPQRRLDAEGRERQIFPER